MLMSNLLEYSDNYSIKSGLWNYYRDENDNDANESNAAKYRINNRKTTISKSFEYKIKIIGRTRSRNNDLLSDRTYSSPKTLS